MKLCGRCGDFLPGARNGARICRTCYAGGVPTIVRAALKAKGLRVVELAGRLGISVATLERAYRGRPMRPTTARLLGEALGVDPAVIVRGEEREL